MQKLPCICFQWSFYRLDGYQVEFYIFKVQIKKWKPIVEQVQCELRVPEPLSTPELAAEGRRSVRHRTWDLASSRFSFTARSPHALNWLSLNCSIEDSLTFMRPTTSEG